MHREEQDLLAGLAQQVEQIARRPRRLALGGEQGAVVPLRPGSLLQRLEEALLLDEQDLVEGPFGPLIALDLQGAERDAVPAMRMVERAARVAVHAGDLALLELVVADDGLEVAPLQLGADRLAHERPDHVEHLARREAIRAMAARLGDRSVEMGEHHLLLAALVLGSGGSARSARRTALPATSRMTWLQQDRFGALPSEVIGM